MTLTMTMARISRSVAMLSLATAIGLSTCAAFAPPTTTTSTSASTFASASIIGRRSIVDGRGNEASAHLQTQLQMQLSGSWEDVLFNAQSAASDLASISLNDPTDLVTSIPIMYGAGLLTSFSPCVWGLLPLTMSYISTAAGERKDKATLLPTFAFAGGLALVFCTLGIIASSVGGVIYGNSGNMSAFLPLMSNGICCLMGLQLLELIRIPLPSLSAAASSTSSSSSSPSLFNGGVGGIGVSNEPLLINASGKVIADDESKQKEQGSLVRTFLLGGSSALVASSCATPVLASILAYVANSSDPILGGTLLLFYTLGYATPLLAVAASGGQLLVNLKEMGNDKTSIYAAVGPWITPLTAGVLLWFGTDGLLHALFGDPSLAALAPIFE